MPKQSRQCIARKMPATFGDDRLAARLRSLRGTSRACNVVDAMLSQVGMPIDAFIKEAMEGLDSGATEIAVGPMGKKFRATVNDANFQQMFDTLNKGL